MNKKGFAVIGIIIAIVLAIAAIGGGVYFVNKQKLGPKPQPPAITQLIPQPTPSTSIISIFSDGEILIDQNSKQLLNMRDLLSSPQFISFAQENNFQRYDDPEHSSFLKIAPLSQDSYLVSLCLNCNEDLYSYDVSLIFSSTDGVSRFFFGREPIFSSDGKLVMLTIWGDAEVTAFSVNVYDLSVAKLLGTFRSRGQISEFAQRTFNITTDTFVTFEFSPDSRSIIITPQVFDGNEYKPFTSKLISDLDGKNLRIQ